MQPSFDHNKLLTKIAKDRLKPHGIEQKGKSRTFLYDHCLYTIVIEFQPSSSAKGTYLNIGVDFNFYPRDYFAFSHGYREKAFQEAEDEAQFTKIIHSYCDTAIKRLDQLKKAFADIDTAISTLTKKSINDPWDYFDVGVLCGLAGRKKQAETMLKRLENKKCEFAYEFERNKQTVEVLTWLEGDSNFDAHIKSLVEKTRLLKKLPTVEIRWEVSSATRPNNIFTFWRK